MTQGDYRNLIVWQKAMELVKEIYSLTAGFPNEEKFVLVSQMRRAAISIPSNIAEGRMRSTRKDYKRFLFNAFGSGAELETQIQIARTLEYVKFENVKAINLLNEVMRMLNVLIQKL